MNKLAKQSKKAVLEMRRPNHEFYKAVTSMKMAPAERRAKNLTVYTNTLADIDDAEESARNTVRVVDSPRVFIKQESRSKLVVGDINLSRLN